MSAPTTRSPRVEAMLDAIVSRDARDDEYWEEISMLGKEVAASAAVRAFTVARCVRGLERAGATAIVRTLDVLMQLEEPIARIAVPLARHPDEIVRSAVVSALEGSRAPDAVATLAALSVGDACPAVRCAAVRAIVRGLGVPSDHDFVDSFVVRDALVKCLGDDDDALVHDEAVIGLAMRKDPRALEPLAILIAEELTGQRVDAAFYFASPDLREVLQRHKDAGTDVCGEWSLDDAIAACAVDLA
jgi:hypothetical protein